MIGVLVDAPTTASPAERNSVVATVLAASVATIEARWPSPS